MKALRELSDQLISKLGSGLSVLGSATGDKATLIVRVSKDLTSRFHAGDIVKELAPLVGGSGGGRPDMAQAGGSDVAGLKNALSKVYELIQSKTS
jgi:alanyl-tRNA synthetase